MAADQNDGMEVADFTHAWMRRVEQMLGNNDKKLDKILDILVRHETRITRMERDVGELKYDMTNVDGHLVTFTTDMLKLVDKIGSLEAKMDLVDQRVARIDGKLNGSPDQPS